MRVNNIHAGFTDQDRLIAVRDPAYGATLAGFLQDEQNADTEEKKLIARSAAMNLRSSYSLAGPTVTPNLYGTDVGIGSVSATKPAYGGIQRPAGTSEGFSLMGPEVKPNLYGTDVTQPPVGSVTTQVPAGSATTQKPTGTDDRFSFMGPEVNPNLYGTDVPQSSVKPFAPQVSGSQKPAASAYKNPYQGLIEAAINQQGNYGSFDYGKQDEIDRMIREIINREAFSYDHEKDPLFSGYKKQYLREGERAMANALAQASATSGGAVSSYALGAAQQAGNYYAAQLSDKIPELEQYAYQKYLQEQAAKMDALGVLNEDKNNAYQQWLDQYSMGQDRFNNLLQQDATAYDRWLNEQNMQLQQDATAYDKETDAYQKAVQMFQILGYATPEIAKVLGIPEGTTVKGYLPVQSGENTDGQPDGDTGKNATVDFTGSSYDEAKKYLHSNGKDDSGLMTKDRWNELHMRYKTGTAPFDPEQEEIAKYDTYEEYLNAYVKWLMG